VELLVVVAILAMLIAMLLPAMGTALEYARISTCQSILLHMGTALNQYVSENHGRMMPWSWKDEISYAVLDQVYGGNPQNDIRYGAWYDYHNLLAPALGLGNCMPVEVPTSDANFWPQWCKSYNVVRSAYKEFQCPAGLGATSPYGPIMDLGRTGPHGSFYMQNASWCTQPISVNWPQYSADFSLFKDTAQAILFYENWACNGDGPDLVIRGQPYSTHYRMGRTGVQGIGRSIIYADFHIKFLPTGDPTQVPFSLWNQYPGVISGNDMGLFFTDPWYGQPYVAWDLYQPLKEKG
jgi:type II secretory pathway pseudopilin PulG